MFYTYINYIISSSQSTEKSQLIYSLTWNILAHMKTAQNERVYRTVNVIWYKYIVKQLPFLNARLLE